MWGCPTGGSRGWGGQRSRAGDSMGEAQGPGSPASAHSCMREGGAAPAYTFQLLPHPSSLFSPVPTVSQPAPGPVLSANSQNPSGFRIQLERPWSECPEIHLHWDNCLPPTQTCAHTHRHTCTHTLNHP